MAAGTDGKRIDYLIQWRQGLWTQIRQKEDAVWRFMSFYTGALIVAGGAILGRDKTKGEIEPSASLLFVLFVFVSTLWGVLILLDANYWFQRNLIFIRNIEKEILQKDDLDVLLPSSFLENYFTYDFSYKVHVNLLYLLLIVNLLLYLGINYVMTFGTVELLFSVAITITLFWGWYSVLSIDQGRIQAFAKAMSQAPGKEIIQPATPSKKPTLDELTNTGILASYTMRWGWLAMYVVCGVLMCVAFKFQIRISEENWNYYNDYAIIVFICISLFISYWVITTTNHFTEHSNNEFIKWFRLYTVQWPLALFNISKVFSILVFLLAITKMTSFL